MLRVLALLVVALLPHAAAGADTTEARTYYGPGTLAPLCFPAASEGGACFDLAPGVAVLTLQVRDASGLPVAWYYGFTDADGHPLPGDGTFCGEAPVVAPVPATASRLTVTVGGVWEMYCLDAPGQATTGTVAVRFA